MRDTSTLPSVAGCAVTTAANGKLALELLKTKEYDVVLIDFLMPVRVE